MDRLVQVYERVQNLYSTILYIDLEGVNLSRTGSVSILTLLLETAGGTDKSLFLFDIFRLQADAFNTGGARGKSLKDILQDRNVPKALFDARNDSDALFAHYGVALQGVEDIQLMASATRNSTSSRKFLGGLSKCLEYNLAWWNKIDGWSRREKWRAAKTTGERLFQEQHGGSCEVFNKRPIPKTIVEYCAADVQHLPELRRNLWLPRNAEWQALVRQATEKRVQESRSPDYQPHGEHKKKAPWNDEQNNMLDKLNQNLAGGHSQGGYLDTDFTDDPFSDYDGGYFDNFDDFFLRGLWRARLLRR